METVILSDGHEFELVSNGVSRYENDLEIKFQPGEFTVEQLIKMWNGNDTITVKDENVSLRVFRGFTVCNVVTIELDYFIDTQFVCPECDHKVDFSATTCDSCNAAFEAPKTKEVRGPVCTVKCSMPNLNDRMSDAEDAIEDLIGTILG